MMTIFDYWELWVNIRPYINGCFVFVLCCKRYIMILYVKSLSAKHLLFICTFNINNDNISKNCVISDIRGTGEVHSQVL